MKHVWLALAALMGCTDGATVAQNPPDATPDPVLEGNPQVPPIGHAALKVWLGEGHYLDWACEPQSHPARPPGAHGENRICSNTALSTAIAGDYPVGAASVKELIRDDQIVGFAVGRKVAAGPGAASWYWYEGAGLDGTNLSVCVNCHVRADRDYVFTQVR